MTDFDNLINIFRKNNILVTNDRLNANRSKYLSINTELSNIYYNYTKQFRTEKEAIYCLIHHIEPENIPRCPMCGKLSKFIGKYYNITCGKCNYNAWEKKIELTKRNTSKDAVERGKEKSRQTCLRKYGVPFVNQFSSSESKTKYEMECLEKYGVKNAGWSKEARLKRINTCLNKYGVDHNFKLLDSSKQSKQIWNDRHDEIISKIEHTCLRKYGSKYYAQTEEFVSQSKQTLINHYGSLKEAYNFKKEKGKQTKFKCYGDKFYHNAEQMSETIKERHTKFELEHDCIQYKKLLDMYGQGWKSLELPIIYNGRFRYVSNEYLDIIKEYSSSLHGCNSVSRPEEEIYEYIRTFYNKEIKRNNRTMIKDDNHQYELDIYLPNIKVAIEFNGTYWHSNLFKDKYYHQLKTKLCKEKNIILIHIFEFEWNKDKNKCLEKIKDVILNYKKYRNIILNDNIKFSEPEIIFETTNKKLNYNVWDDGLNIYKIKNNEK